MTQLPPDAFGPNVPRPVSAAPRPLLPLEYAPTQSSRSRGAFAARIVAGFLGYIGLSVAWVWAAYRFWNPPNPPDTAVAGSWLVMTVVLLGLALYLRRRGRPGYGYGILLVLLLVVGVILLILGICWLK